MDAWQRDVHRAALTVMRATGAAVGLPASGGDCCGALHTHAGRVAQARRLARRVMASMPGDAPVVVDSAGCGAAMKDYGRLLGTPAAHAFAARVRDFSEWVADQPPLRLRDTGDGRGAGSVPPAPRPTGAGRGAHGARAGLPPPGDRRRRPVLRRGRCVRGARTRARGARSATGRCGALRAAQGDATGPLVVVSANPGCAMHLGAAGLTVRHPAELLARALVEPEPPDA